MENIKIFKSVINSNIINEIEDANWCADLVQYATYKCKIDGLIAAAYLFCPQIIQVKDYIFIEQFWNCNEEDSFDQIIRLEEQYHNDKKAIEMSVNTWSIGDFFVGESSELMDNDKIIAQFANTIVYFWKSRVRTLFPDRKIIVKLDKDLMGEFGICVTMYEDIVCEMKEQ